MNIKLLAPLRILLSASGAVHHWWAQRLTAVVLVPLSLWVVYSLAIMHSADYETVILWLNNLEELLNPLHFELLITNHIHY